MCTNGSSYAEEESRRKKRGTRKRGYWRGGAEEVGGWSTSVSSDQREHVSFPDLSKTHPSMPI
jgi:hypothetical protein